MLYVAPFAPVITVPTPVVEVALYHWYFKFVPVATTLKLPATPSFTARFDGFVVITIYESFTISLPLFAESVLSLKVALL